ncbi:MAG: YerC/YecD family TrpR-related protein, partial [Patescibacteria group bacterium]|jgi:TrpR-related protein YerC/YecD
VDNSHCQDIGGMITYQRINTLIFYPQNINTLYPFTTMPKKNIDWNTKKTDNLFEAILALKTREECRAFFRDLCTLEEIASMADRWQMVMLLTKNTPYRQIAKKLAVSTTTVARVANWFEYGQGGYRLIAQRLKLGVSKQVHHSQALR